MRILWQNKRYIGASRSKSDCVMSKQRKRIVNVRFTENDVTHKKLRNLYIFSKVLSYIIAPT